MLFSSTCFSNAQVGSLQSPENVHLVVAERRTLRFSQAVVLTSSTIAAGMNVLTDQADDGAGIEDKGLYIESPSDVGAYDYDDNDYDDNDYDDYDDHDGGVHATKKSSMKWKESVLLDIRNAECWADNFVNTQFGKFYNRL